MVVFRDHLKLQLHLLLEYLEIFNFLHLEAEYKNTTIGIFLIVVCD